MWFKKSILLIPALGILCGCQAQSSIQAKYIDQQNVCRAQAESLPVTAEGQKAPAESGYAIVARFSECMNRAGWHVAVPKPATPLPQNPNNVAQNPPTGVFPSTPPAVSSTIAQPAAPLASPAASGSAPTASPVLGPGVTPNPPPATSSPGSYYPSATTPAAPSYNVSPPASYQPSLNATPTRESPYGTGAGRQF